MLGFKLNHVSKRGPAIEGLTNHIPCACKHVCIGDGSKTFNTHYPMRNKLHINKTSPVLYDPAVNL